MVSEKNKKVTIPKKYLLTNRFGIKTPPHKKTTANKLAVARLDFLP